MRWVEWDQGLETFQKDAECKSSMYNDRCCCWVASVVSNSVWPHRQQPTRLPRPWDSPGKNTGVGCHCLLQCRKVKSVSEVAQSCLTLHDPMDCSPPGASAHGIFQARVLEWVAIAFSLERLDTVKESSKQSRQTWSEIPSKGYVQIATQTKCL